MPIGLKGNVDGSGAIQVGGSDALTLSTDLNATFVGTVSASAVISPTGALYPLVSGTAQASTSGTSIDFTGIPATAKRVSIVLNGVSLNASAVLLVQIGTSSGFELTSYASAAGNAGGTVGSLSTIGFNLTGGTSAAGDAGSGLVTLTNVSGDTWVETGNFSNPSGPTIGVSCGNKTLAGVLDRVRVTTVAGTATFDAGSINIMWE